MASLWIRRTAIAAVALLLLLALGAGILIARFDAAHFKSLAADWMQSEYQRKLQIDGPIGLSVLPRLAVKVSGLTLSEAGSDVEFLAVEKASLALRLWPLLSGALSVDRIAAQGLRIKLHRDAQGRGNFDDLLRSADSPAKPTTTAENDKGSGGAPAFDIRALNIDKAQLTVKDEAAGLAGELALHSLSLGRLAPGLSSPLELKGRVSLQQPQPLQIDLDGRMMLRWDPAQGLIEANDVDLGVLGDVAGFTGLKMPLRAKQIVYGTTSQSLQVQALDLNASGSRLESRFEFSLLAPQFALGEAAAPGGALSGRFKWTGAAELSGTFKAAALTGRLGALQLPGLQVDFSGTQAGRNLSAQLSTDARFDSGKGGASLEDLKASAQLVVDGGKPVQLKLDGAAKAGAEGAEWTLSGNLDGGALQFSGQAGWTGAVPNLRAQARFAKLDLNALQGQAGAAPGGAAASESALPFDGLSALTGRLDFSADELAYRAYRVSDARLLATLNAGRLSVETLSGRAWSGRFTASGSALASDKSLALKLDAQDVDIHALLSQIADKDLLEGRGRVIADLRASGESASQLRSSLAGSASLLLRDGAVRGYNLARSLRQAKAALTQRQDAVSQASQTEKTDFTELSVSAKLIDGVAYSDDLEIKSPYLRVGGKGSVDLARGRINYTSLATVTTTARGQGGDDLSALRGVSVPVLLTGPLDDMAWKLQWSAVVASAVENRLKEKLAEKLGGKLGERQDGASDSKKSPEDLLREKLRGLFK